MARLARRRRARELPQQSAAEVLRQAAAPGAGEARSIELDRLGAFVRKREVSQASRGTLRARRRFGRHRLRAGLRGRGDRRSALDAQAARRQAHRDAPVLPAQRVRAAGAGAIERERVSVATHPDAYREEGRATRPPKLLSLRARAHRQPVRGPDVLMGMSGWIRRCSAARRSRRCSPCSCCTNGREFSRDKLVGLCGPTARSCTGAKNFYGIWAMLRRALTLPSGECPYLIRQQQG